MDSLNVSTITIFRHPYIKYLHSRICSYVCKGIQSLFATSLQSSMSEGDQNIWCLGTPSRLPRNEINAQLSMLHIQLPSVMQISTRQITQLRFSFCTNAGVHENCKGWLIHVQWLMFFVYVRFPFCTVHNRRFTLGCSSLSRWFQPQNQCACRNLKFADPLPAYLDHVAVTRSRSWWEIRGWLEHDSSLLLKLATFREFSLAIFLHLLFGVYAFLMRNDTLISQDPYSPPSLT